MTLTILIRRPNPKQRAFQLDSVVQLDLVGALQIGPGADSLSETLDVLIGKFDHILINMAQLRHLDARGIGCLIHAYAAGSRNGTRVSICNIPPLITELLIIVKLLAVFAEDQEVLPNAA